jgi:hypothetical protein
MPPTKAWPSRRTCVEEGEGAIATREPPCKVGLVALERDQCGKIGGAQFADLMGSAARNTGRRFQVLLEKDERSPF